MKVKTGLSGKGLMYASDETNISVWALSYSNGRLGLQLTAPSDEFEGDEPLMTLTVNLPDEPCLPDEVFIKDYSENEGAAAWAVANGIVEATPVGQAQSGFVVIEKFKLTTEFALLCMAALEKGKNFRKQGGNATIGAAITMALLGVLFVLLTISLSLGKINHELVRMNAMHALQSCSTDDECEHLCKQAEFDNCEMFPQEER